VIRFGQIYLGLGRIKILHPQKHLIIMAMAKVTSLVPRLIPLDRS